MVYTTAEDLKDRLKEKGWTQEEIAETVKIIKESSSDKTAFEKFIDQSIFWVLLLLLITGNLLISVGIIPFMLVATWMYLYPGLFFVGLVFGKLFDVVIWDIEHLEHSTHIYPWLFLTAIAIINIFIITVLSNDLAVTFGMSTHNPITVSITYVLGFLLPYYITRRHTFSLAKIYKPS